MTSPALPRQVQLRAKRRTENFPVALRVLPKARRRDLLAVYDVVRTIDDLGDDPAYAPEARTAMVTAFGSDLYRAWSGSSPDQAVNQALQLSVRARGLSREPFEQLIAANLQDQQVTEYETFEDLIEYCRLSAAPLGRLVLEVFGTPTGGQLELSDEICNALQVVEHLQDVREDLDRGRIYLPRRDMVEFGVSAEDLRAAMAGPSLRRLIQHEARRAEVMLDSGTPLIGLLRGWAKLAVAAYLAGGRATVAAIRTVDGDVLTHPAKAGRRDLLRQLAKVLRHG